MVMGGALALALGACSDDGDESGDAPRAASTSDDGAGADPTADPTVVPSDDPSVTEVTVDCPAFEDAARRIADAQALLYGPSGDPEQAIADLQVELEALKEGAPDDVRQALTDLGAGFEDAAELLADPTKGNQARLVALAPELAEAGERITTYVTEQCG